MLKSGTYAIIVINRGHCNIVKGEVRRSRLLRRSQ